MRVPGGLFVAEYPAEHEQAPTVVLVHGSMDRASSFSRLRDRLTDCNVLTYDRRGYRRSSEASPSTGGIDLHAADLIALLDDRPALAFGHSFGGDVVLAAACRRPDLLSGVVAYEPPMPWASWWPTNSAGQAALATQDPGDAAERFMRRVLGDTRWERLSERTRNQRRSDGPALLAEMASVHDKAPFDPRELAVPAVIVRGSLSHSRHRHSSKDMASSIPDGRLVEIDGAGHDGHMSHPDAVAAIILGLAADCGLVS